MIVNNYFKKILQKREKSKLWFVADIITPTSRLQATDLGSAAAAEVALSTEGLGDVLTALPLLLDPGLSVALKLSSKPKDCVLRRFLPRRP